MPWTFLLPALLAALALASQAAVSALPDTVGLQLEICRLPGMPLEGDQAIRIPAGTIFIPMDVAAGFAPATTAASPPLTVILAAPATIASSAFCVRAPIRLAGTPGSGAVRAELDGMFRVKAEPAKRTLDRIYALLRRKESGEDTDEP
jgi:hypothetical protein